MQLYIKLFFLCLSIFSSVMPYVAAQPAPTAPAPWLSRKEVLCEAKSVSIEYLKKEKELGNPWSQLNLYSCTALT